MLLSPPRRPFEGRSVVYVVPPCADQDSPPILQALPRLLAQDQDAIATELGAPIEVVPSPPPGAPTHGTWLIGPGFANPWIGAAGIAPTSRPTHHLDRHQRLLVTDAPDTAGLVGAFAGLRSLARLDGGLLPYGHAHTLEEAIRRVCVEVPDTVPHLRTRHPDWTARSARFALDVRSGQDPIGDFQRWLATIGDLHTWVRPARPQPGLPYRAVAEGDDLRLIRVPPWSEGAARGVRPGFRLTGLPVRAALSRTPGAAHARAWLAARTLLSAPAGTEVELEARGQGKVIRWRESVRWPEGPPVAWGRHDAHTGWIWIGGWFPELGVDDALLEALEALQGVDRLIVDLRGNAGGRLSSALDFRDRLLDRPILTGWERSTEPGGRLGRWRRLEGRPVSSGPRFLGQVLFLTDACTFSASERLLMGLSPPRFYRLGMPTGGGVGRVRRLPLLPGWRLTMTMSEVVSPQGRAIEGIGLSPDHLAPIVPEPHGQDSLMDRARTWPPSPRPQS